MEKSQFGKASFTKDKISQEAPAEDLSPSALDRYNNKERLHDSIALGAS